MKHKKRMIRAFVDEVGSLIDFWNSDTVVPQSKGLNGYWNNIRRYGIKSSENIVKSRKLNE